MFDLLARLTVVFFGLFFLIGCEPEDELSNTGPIDNWELHQLDGRDTMFFPPPTLRIGTDEIVMRSNCSEWRWARAGTVSEPMIGDAIPVVSCDLGLTDETERLLQIVQTRPAIKSGDSELVVQSPEGTAVFSRIE